MTDLITIGVDDLAMSPAMVRDRIKGALVAGGWKVTEDLEFAAARSGPVLHTVALEDLPSHLYSLDIVRIIGERGIADPGSTATAMRTFLGPRMKELAHDLPRFSVYYRRPAFVTEGGRFRPAYEAEDWRGWLFMPGPVDTTPDESMQALREVFKDVKFRRPHHLGNLITFLAAAMARPACPEFPLLVIGGIKDSGKSRVARAVATIILGSAPPDLSYSANEHELQLTMASAMQQSGPNVFLFDNLVGTQKRAAKIMGGTLAQAATSPRFRVRKLYAGSVPCFAPVVICTMNAASLSHDLADRTLYVEPLHQGRPGVSYYFNPDPQTFAAANVPAIRAGLYHLLSKANPDMELPVGSNRFAMLARIGAAVTAELGMPTNFQAGAEAADINAALRQLALLVLEAREAEDVPVPGPMLANMCRRFADQYGELAQMLLDAGGSDRKGAEVLTALAEDHGDLKISKVYRGKDHRVVVQSGGFQLIPVEVEDA